MFALVLLAAATEAAQWGQNIFETAFVVGPIWRFQSGLGLTKMTFVNFSFPNLFNIYQKLNIFH